MQTKINAVITVTIPCKAIAVHNVNSLLASQSTTLSICHIKQKKNVIISAVFEGIDVVDLEAITSAFEDVGIEALIKVINHVTTANEN